MTGRRVVIIVGAGPGVGAAVARRFAREQYAVGLVSRTAARLDRLAADLRESTGASVATATADATDSTQVESAVAAITDELGPPTALCFSPLPDVGLIKPVLETSPDDLMASLRLNVAGAAAAVAAVLPAMADRGSGSLLFTTGSAALAPDARRAASAVTTTAASVYVSLLRDALGGTGVRVGHTVVVGPIGDEDGQHDPDDVAADLWRHHVGEADGFPTALRLPRVPRTS
jgi:short-subunit dehydrogenase